jgi:hypothetical protein
MRMRNDKRPAVLLIVATVVLLLALVVSPVLAASFADVASDTFDDPDYPDAVSALSDLGTISGFSDGTFRPHDAITRQQFAKLVVKLSGCPMTGEEICPFGDVSDTPSASDPLYPAKYVAVCAALGVAQGVDATHFAPYKNITRAQAISMLIRMAQQQGVALQAPTEAYYAGQVANSVFYDLEDPVHGANVQIAEVNNLLWGIWPDQGNTWGIYGKATRGEVAHIMWRLWQKMGSPVTTTTSSSTTTTTATTTTTSPTSTSTTTSLPSTTTSEAATTTTTLSDATLLYKDDFSDDKSGWPVGLSNWSTTKYQDGAYVIECQGATSGWGAPDWEITDARVVANVTIKEGAGNDSCGILFRVRSGARYEFAITADGHYGLWYRTASSVALIVNWTDSEALKHVGATNRVQIVLAGNAMSFNANGSFLCTVEDATLPSGSVGFSVNSAGLYAVKATLDNLEVWSR